MMMMMILFHMFIYSFTLIFLLSGLELTLNTYIFYIIIIPPLLHLANVHVFFLVHAFIEYY